VNISAASYEALFSLSVQMLRFRLTSEQVRPSVCLLQ
jgi:hypothetical protein